MNRDCNGDEFQRHGRRYVRCLADSAITQIETDATIETCPNCARAWKPSEPDETFRRFVEYGGLDALDLAYCRNEAASLRADRDRLAAEVERLTKERDDAKQDAALAAGLPRDFSSRAVQQRNARAQLVRERDAAIAARDEARRSYMIVADAIASESHSPQHLAEIARTIRKRAKAAEQARDSAVNDTAEAIARWLEESTRGQQPQGGRNTVRIDVAIKTAEAIRAGAWRGQNGGG